MATARFRPTVYPLEAREVPASGVTPQQVFTAIDFVKATPPTLTYLEENLAQSRAGGAGQSLLSAADLNRAAAGTLTGFLRDAQEQAAANPGGAGRLNELAGMAGVLIVQALKNASDAEVLASRLGVTRPVPPAPPPTGDGGNSVLVPRPDQNPPTGTPVSPTTPVDTVPPSDGSRLATTLPSLTDPGFVAVGTEGLRVQDVRVGEGTTATATSTTTVRYRGFLASDGTSFDNNVGTGNVLTAILGPTPNVIEGFAQGIVGMRVGGIRYIDIPSDLGYGATGAPPSIPPNSRLVFAVQLLTVA